MKSKALLCLTALATAALAMIASAATRYNHGFVGLGIDAFEPPCAFACRDSISGATLKCSTVEEMHGMEGMDMAMATTAPDCYATDDAFLQTLAWCVKSRCEGLPDWKLEKYWKENVAGAFAVQPDPKMSYRQALGEIEGTPAGLYNESGVLNSTSVVAESLWFPAYNNDVVFKRQEIQHERYGLVLLLSGVMIPIGFSLIRFVPCPAALRSKFYAVLIDAPLFGEHRGTLSRLGLDAALTRGQALFIFYLFVVNVVLSAVNFEYADPNTWYPGNKWRWMAMQVANRLGVLSFANLPLVFLYAGRNNFLLWLTNWSHSTFILLHRWIAGIATLQAILHSLVYLRAFVRAGTHATESVKPYWYWGIVGTLGMSMLFPTSVSLIRRKFYEAFLAWHIVVSILVVVGCYWHIVFEFQHAWGYELWIIISIAVWAFDRVARCMRMARHGLKTAEVTLVDEEYVRVTVRGVTGSGYAYLYFPTLSWRVWENHPFSVASTVLSSQPQTRNISPMQDIEKHPETHTASVDSSGTPHPPAEAGITFYIRDKSGLTARLRTRTTLPVLLETGYTSHPPSALNRCPKLIVIAGGVGITAVLPYLRAHPGRMKLYWGCRTRALIDDVGSTGALAHVEQEVFLGNRMRVGEVLREEVARAGGGEVAVLVSGPEGMAAEARDEVRSIVVDGKEVKVSLFVESFSW